MSDPGILAGAVYIPRFGVAGRRGRRFRCGSDEDGVTLAVEAGEQALALRPGGAASIDGLFLALRHGPEVSGPLPQLVREALDVPAGARVATATADDLGGMTALQAALDAVHHGGIDTALVIASEAAPGAGNRRSAGAAALIVSAAAPGEAVQIAELTRRSALTHGGGDIRYLQHRYEALVQEAIEGLEGNGSDDMIFSGGFPPGGPTGFDGADFGPAGPLMAVVHAMRALPSRQVALLAYGDGQAAVFRLSVPASVACHWDIPEGELEPPVPAEEVGPALSLPAESPYFARTWGESLRLDAARCERCGRVAFPPSQRRICAGCHEQRWQPYRLARTGVVASHIDNHFLPAGFPPRLVFALGELDDGQRYWAPMPAEVRGDSVAIGDPVELHLRRFTVRDGLPVYGMKFVPA